jgi:hypothetical protein
MENDRRLCRRDAALARLGAHLGGDIEWRNHRVRLSPLGAIGAVERKMHFFA